jgi:ABC-type Zn2+ transport system substrate-binding protein/surface adhesin
MNSTSSQVSDEWAAISARSRMNDTSTARISSWGVVAPISAILACIRSKLCTAIDNLVAVFGGASPHDSSLDPRDMMKDLIAERSMTERSWSKR